MTEKTQETAQQSKLFVPISQEESGYVGLSTTKNQACANCRFFQYDGYGYSACALISNHPDPIMNTGWCDRWEGEPEMMMDMGKPIPVVIMDMEDMEGMGKAKQDVQKASPITPTKHTDRKSIWQTVIDLFRRKQSNPVTQFKVLGNGYWAAWYSNNFEDRDQEIIAAEAHDKFISRVKGGLVPYPELWFWHIPGTRHGKALWLERIDHMVLAIGRFDDTPFAKIMQRHYESTDEIYAMSHGFTSDKNKHFRNGVWYDINTFEVSPLAPDVAANVFTLFSEVNSMVNAKALESLKNILLTDMGEAEGQKAYDDLLAVTKAMNDDAEAIGKRYKDFTDPAKADQPNPAAPTPDQSKALTPLVIELTQSQADVVKTQRLQTSQFDTIAVALKAIQEDVKGLHETLSLTPRRASQDPVTAISDDQAQKIKEANGEYDSFWADLKVVKT